jgi:hypothetical protein
MAEKPTYEEFGEVFTYQVRCNGQLLALVIEASDQDSADRCARDFCRDLYEREGFSHVAVARQVFTHKAMQ